MYSIIRNHVEYSGVIHMKSDNKKTAVVFPGVGYTKDRPLLYYAGKLAAKNGYELTAVDFAGLDWSKEKLKDSDFLRETMEKCMLITEDALSQIADLSDSQVVFISKSIGTVVATAYAKRAGISPVQICFSPLEMIGEYVPEGGAVLFCGDADPYADYKTVEQIATDKKLEIRRIAGGNHSLETGDVATDIDNLQKMMQRVSELL